MRVERSSSRRCRHQSRRRHGTGATRSLPIAAFLAWLANTPVVSRIVLEEHLPRVTSVDPVRFSISRSSARRREERPELHRTCQLLLRVLTSGHGGCTFTVRQTRTGAIPEAGGTADADGARAQARNLSAFCYVPTQPCLVWRLDRL